MIGAANLVAVRDQRRRHDWVLMGSAVLLMFIGLMAIHSHDVAFAAARLADPTAKHKLTLSDRLGGEAVKQALFGVLGVIAMVACAYGNVELWQRLSGPMWWFNNIALLATKLVGLEVNGSKRWLAVGGMTIQPSDFTNLFIVLTLATFFVAHQEEVQSKRTLLRSFLHILPSVILIALQPHYGGALCLIVAWLCISLFAGTPAKRLLIVVGSSLVCLVAILASPPLLRRVFHGYQSERIIAKFESILRGRSDEQAKSSATTGGRPAKSAATVAAERKADYQQKQSETAIAMGGVVGEGYLNGVRKAANYIPEQQSDFVFSIIGEELGFTGSLLTLAAFGLFFYRVWLVIFRSRDPMAQMVAAGVFGVLGFHTIVNLAMVLNVSFTIGLWLPFMSSGGTALISSLMMVGILDSFGRN